MDQAGFRGIEVDRDLGRRERVISGALLATACCSEEGARA
jgi:hypothetical protein